MLKLVAFDLDGTLADSLPLSTTAFQKAVSPFAGYHLTVEEIVKTFGLNEPGMIRQIIPNSWEEASEAYFKLYEEMHNLCPKPFDGIIELLEYLKRQNIPIALITGKAKRSCDITLKKLKLINYFDNIQTGSIVRPNKDELLKNLLKEYALSSNEIVYIGDMVSDVIACNNVNVCCLSAAWSPSASFSELLNINPKYTFISVEQLKNHLMQLLS